MNKLNKAIVLAMEEVALDTVDKVMQAFKNKFEMDESDLNEFANEFKESLKETNKELAKSMTKRGKKSSGEAKEKKKREPTAYNLFIKSKMAEIKETNPEIKGKELMRAAVEAWNAEKKTGDSE